MWLQKYKINGDDFFYNYIIGELRKGDNKSTKGVGKWLRGICTGGDLGTSRTDFIGQKGQLS